MSAASSSLPKNPNATDHAVRCTVAAIEGNPYSPLSVLPTEDRIAYDRLGSMLIECYEPGTQFELNLVTEIQDHDWSLRRLSSIEKGLQTLGVLRHLEPAAALAGDPALAPGLADALAYKEDVKLYEQIARQCARLYRRRDKLAESLADLISRRKRAEQEAALRAKQEESLRRVHDEILAYAQKNRFVPTKSESGAVIPAVEPPESPLDDFFPRNLNREPMWRDLCNWHRHYRGRIPK